MKEYVLVVDDEQSLRQVLELFFKKEGFEVDTASSLAEAEAAIVANAYDLVLTDLRMAGAFQCAGELDPLGLDHGVDDALSHASGSAADGYLDHEILRTVLWI